MTRSTRQTLLFARLSGSVALIALAAATPSVAAAAPLDDQVAAADQAADQAEQDEKVDAEIVVTGTSIRGVPPTGSNLIQLGPEAVIETGSATVQELLATIPQLGTFNQAPRPGARSNGILSTAPDIRGLGQAQTLTLINGHRIVGAGHLQNIADPSIVPPSILQRVEVIADGASSVYGSDGIAGVVNLITRRDYEGATATFRYGLGDDYDLLNTNAVIGTKWDGGGIVASVEYSATSRLRGIDRNYGTTNFTSVGGQDVRSQNTCVPSSFRLQNANGGATGDFIEFGTGNRNVRCDNSRLTDLYPRQERLSFFASGHHEAAPGIELFFDAFHSTTDSDADRGPTGASGTIRRTNPFFPSAQVDPSVNAVTAFYNVNNLTGVPLNDKQRIEIYGGTVGIEADISAFKWTTYVTGSRSKTDLHEGSFSPIVNSQALAATTLADALDPFSGRTSAAVKVGLANYEQFFGSKQWLWELNSKIDGPIFDLPGGAVKIALGGVYRKEFYDGKNTLSRIGFEENLGAQIGDRRVVSAFGELFIPVFGDSNATSIFQRLDVSLSGRFDSYSDFGDTFNPKVGINWSPINGIALRGSYGTSFHAPALPDLFGPDTRAGFGTGGLTPAGVTPIRTGNIFIAGGNPNLQPETATTWSAGIDVTPESLPGFKFGATYYNIDFRGRIAFPESRFFYVLPEFNQFFIDNISCPGGQPYRPGSTGCTSLPIDPQKVFDTIKGLRLQNFPGPVNTPADIPPVFILTILRRANLAVINTSGLDFDLSYRWNMGATALSAQVQANRVLNYDQTAIPGAPKVDQFPFGQAKFRARGSLSARGNGVTAVANINYSDKYQAQYVAVSGTTSTQSVETIAAFTTVDLHFGYELPKVGILEGTELTLDVDNLTDADPPLTRSGNGIGVGNVLGRVVTFGIRKKF